MINEEVAKLLLNGMPFREFIIFYLTGIFGIVIYFLGNLFVALENDSSTPKHWSWRAFLKGGIRLFLSITGLAFGIIFFKELSPYLFNLSGMSSMPNDVVIDVNMLSAFLLGLIIDRVVKGGLHILIKSYNKGTNLIKKTQNGRS